MNTIFNPTMDEIKVATYSLGKKEAIRIKFKEWLIEKVQKQAKGKVVKKVYLSSLMWENILKHRECLDDIDLETTTVNIKNGILGYFYGWELSIKKSLSRNKIEIELED